MAGLATGPWRARGRRRSSVASILEGVLQSDVFVRDVALDLGALDGWRRGLCGDGCLLGRGAVERVLEDSWCRGSD